MKEKITLYHGTVHSFDSIDISLGKPYKDFGKLPWQYFFGSKKSSELLILKKREILS